jgi:hypothetical protein
MLFKKIYERLKTDFATEQDDDFLKLFTSFKENAPNDEDRISDVLSWAKSQGNLDDLEINDENAETLLRSFLVERDLPEELIRNENLRNELTQVIAKRATESSPLRPEEAMEGLQLILTGELFEDISYTISVLFALIAKPERFSNPHDNLKAFVEGLINLPGAIVSDVDPRIVGEKVSRQIVQIQSGQPIEPPDLLNNTLAGIYALPEVGDLIDTANALLDEENKSLRIALLIYARLNGINLEQQDIDKVRATVLNRKNPDLGSLLIYLGDRETRSRLIL